MKYHIAYELTTIPRDYRIKSKTSIGFEEVDINHSFESFDKLILMRMLAQECLEKDAKISSNLIAISVLK